MNAKLNFPVLSVSQQTPTAFCHSAQGCEARTTLGNNVILFRQPQRGCGSGVVGANGHNPLGVGNALRRSPKVAPPTAQPWAEGRNPVGILRYGFLKASIHSPAIFFQALTGRTNVSPGQRPGKITHKNPKALKGRNNTQQYGGAA